MTTKNEIAIEEIQKAITQQSRVYQERDNLEAGHAVLVLKRVLRSIEDRMSEDKPKVVALTDAQYEALRSIFHGKSKHAKRLRTWTLSSGRYGYHRNIIAAMARKGLVELRKKYRHSRDWTVLQAGFDAWSAEFDKRAAAGGPEKNLTEEKGE